MKWECSECGAITSASRRPVACGDCGTAGVIFVETDGADADGLGAGSLTETWFEAGARFAAHNASETFSFA